MPRMSRFKLVSATAAVLAGALQAAAQESTPPAATEACPLPGGSTLFSLMAYESATILASSVSRGLAIGGNLARSDQGSGSAAINGPAYIGGTASGSFSFNAGVFPGTPVWQALFPWTLFEDIGRRAVSGTFDSGGRTYRIITVSSGGTYTSDDFGVGSEDGSRTLVVFNTFEDIALAPTSSGVPFSASVLAPFSSVIALGSTGSVRGLVVARRYGNAITMSAGSVPSGETLSLAGAAYSGPVFCGETVATSGVVPVPPTPAPTAAPTTLPPTSAPTTAPPTTRAPTTKAPTVAPTVEEDTEEPIERGTEEGTQAEAKGGKSGGMGNTADVVAADDDYTAADRGESGSGSGSGADKLDVGSTTESSPKKKSKKAKHSPKSKSKSKKHGKSGKNAEVRTFHGDHHGSIAAVTFGVMGAGCIVLVVAIRRLRKRAARYDPLSPGRAEALETTALTKSEGYGTYGTEGWFSEYAVPTPSQLVFAAANNEW